MSNDCVSCYNTPFRCNNTDKVVYTGNPSYSCEYGCPGDCHDADDVFCFTVYKCADDIDYLALCDTVQVAPGEWAWKCVGPFAWDCYECVRDPTDPGKEHYLSNAKCN